jgi:hypothetical protein
MADQVMMLDLYRRHVMHAAATGADWPELGKKERRGGAQGRWREVYSGASAGGGCE